VGGYTPGVRSRWIAREYRSTASVSVMNPSGPPGPHVGERPLDGLGHQSAPRAISTFIAAAISRYKDRTCSDTASASERM
jgi:hypothetical protein